MRASERLKGTMLELPPFKAAPTKRRRENGQQVRRTPPGSISMAEIAQWPHAIRVPQYYGSREVPFDAGTGYRFEPGN